MKPPRVLVAGRRRRRASRSESSASPSERSEAETASSSPSDSPARTQNLPCGSAAPEGAATDGAACAGSSRPEGASTSPSRAAPPRGPPKPATPTPLARDAPPRASPASARSSDILSSIPRDGSVTCARPPFLLWLTGGDHCSVLSGLALEIGPFQFVIEPYNGTVPSLQLNPYSWTKVANILFVDAPVGAGFSFSRKPEGYNVGDVSASLQLHELLIKWFTDHPAFLANHLYIGGDSYAGKIVPFIAQKISEGVEAGRSPHLNLKGYLVGNPATGEIIDYSAAVPYAHGVGIISDQLYETISGHCHGEDYKYPTNALCGQALDTYKSLLSEVRWGQILLDNCGGFTSTGPGKEMDDSAGAGRKILSEEKDGAETVKRLRNPPPSPTLDCQTYGIYLSYFWANDQGTRDALGIKDGTVEEWVRCHNGDVPYTADIRSSIKYHRNVTANGYRALVYSGDHDAMVPHLGTQAWVRSLGFPIVDDWRAWHLQGQSAGFTITYSNNMTFATIKGAGHTAPEFEPERCFAMFSRWILNQQL